MYISPKLTRIIRSKRSLGLFVSFLALSSSVGKSYAESCEDVDPAYADCMATEPCEPGNYDYAFFEPGCGDTCPDGSPLFNGSLCLFPRSASDSFVCYMEPQFPAPPGTPAATDPNFDVLVYNQWALTENAQLCGSCNDTTCSIVAPPAPPPICDEVDPAYADCMATEPCEPGNYDYAFFAPGCGDTCPDGSPLFNGNLCLFPRSASDSFVCYMEPQFPAPPGTPAAADPNFDVLVYNQWALTENAQLCGSCNDTTCSIVAPPAPPPICDEVDPAYADCMATEPCEPGNYDYAFFEPGCGDTCPDGSPLFNGSLCLFPRSASDSFVCYMEPQFPAPPGTPAATDPNFDVLIYNQWALTENAQLCGSCNDTTCSIISLETPPQSGGVAPIGGLLPMSVLGLGCIALGSGAMSRRNDDA